MDFIGYDCDGCAKPFHADDDIVVCPICGTPQHRECYDNLGHCVNEEKHAENYSWEQEHKQAKEDATTKCNVCGYKNSDDALFCSHCGQPINGTSQPNVDCNKKDDDQEDSDASPFSGMGGFGFGSVPPIDFAKAFTSNEEIAPDVTTNEMTTFVGQNKPYYYTIFNRIKKFHTSRFNFCAFLFTGGWYLYRKQYLKGVIISLVVAASLILSTMYIGYFSNTAYSILTSGLSALDIETYTSVFQEMEVLFQGVSKLGAIEQLMFYTPVICNLLYIVIRFVCGATANKGYYRYCTDKIRFIKGKNNSTSTADVPKDETEKAVDTTVSSKNQIALIKAAGGVNSPIAIVFLVCALIIEYLPIFL